MSSDLSRRARFSRPHPAPNRYVVEDVDPDEHGVKATFNTTLKAIVPLPHSAATLPKRDYTVGSKVLALYPETSCFYTATIKGGGPGLHKLSAQKVRVHASGRVLIPIHG